MKLVVNSLDDLGEAACEFVKNMHGNRLFAFYGTMGAGKTTFIREICHCLGFSGVVTSPTFALVNEYSSASGERIFHFDFYRIDKVEELYDFGYEDYLYSDAYCFIEWPEKGEEILPGDTVKVRITESGNGTRIIEWQ